jgi:hypothetical protein
VNECCGAYCIHDSTETFNLALDAHLEDLRKLVDLIISTAETAKLDPQRRVAIQMQARHYLAHHAIGIIGSHRSRGMKRRELLALIWRWRRRLIYLWYEDLPTLARLIIVFVCSPSFLDRVRNVKRKLRPAV